LVQEALCCIKETRKTRVKGQRNTKKEMEKWRDKGRVKAREKGKEGQTEN
jgi:hypothetical protein